MEKDPTRITEDDMPGMNDDVIAEIDELKEFLKERFWNIESTLSSIESDVDHIKSRVD